MTMDNKCDLYIKNEDSRTPSSQDERLFCNPDYVKIAKLSENKRKLKEKMNYIEEHMNNNCQQKSRNCPESVSFQNLKKQLLYRYNKANKADNNKLDNNKIYRESVLLESGQSFMGKWANNTADMWGILVYNYFIDKANFAHRTYRNTPEGEWDFQQVWIGIGNHNVVIVCMCQYRVSGHLVTSENSIRYLFKFDDDGNVYLDSENENVTWDKIKELFPETEENLGSLEDAIEKPYYTPLKEIGSIDNLVDYMNKKGVLIEDFKENKEDKLGLTESILLEKKRSELISKSKSGAEYKSDKSKGRNRWERRVHSKLSTSVADYNQIDMNTFWKEDLLEFGIKVQGETDNYVVTVTFEKVLERLRREIEVNNNKLEFKNVLRALINTFNSEDVYVACSCLDFKYGGFNHYSYRQGYNSNPEFGPAMDAPVIRNPTDNLGAGCKHINLVLANLSWMMKIASVINNYIWYCKDNMELNYGKYIFPKLYGMDYEKAVQLVMTDYDENGELNPNLATDEATINLSNAIGRRRTQYKTKPEPSVNPRFERTRKPEPEKNPLKLQFNDEEEVNEEPRIYEPESEEER